MADDNRAEVNNNKNPENSRKNELNAIAERQSKQQIFKAIADELDVNKKEVADIFKALSKLIHQHMVPDGSGEFRIPEIGIKVRRVKKPATKPREILSPITGQTVYVEAKPERYELKATILKPLKELIFSEN